MELINPTITIRNTDSGLWLVRLEHRVSGVENIDITLLVERSQADLPTVQRQLMQRAVQLLSAMSNHT